MKVTIRVRDANLIEQAQLDAWTSLEMVPRFNDVGTWALTVPYSPASLAQSQLLNSGSGIVVRRDGPSASVIMSGPVLHREQTGDVNGTNLTISGADDNVWLVRRVAHPSPGDGNFATQAFDVRTGVASTVLRQYVDVNAGVSALTARRVSGLALDTDPGVGATVTGRARLQLLITLLQDLAQAGGALGFRTVQSGTSLLFQVSQPVDRSTTVIFDIAKGNLLSVSWSEDSPAGNYVYCGGIGDGTARVFSEGQDGVSVATWGRVEEFLDRRDLSGVSELQQAIGTQLASDSSKLGLVLTPIDIPQLMYGTHYNLGDNVTTIIRNNPISQIVREVNLKITDDGGLVVVPTIGTPGRTTLLKLFDRLRKNERRVSQVARN